MIALSLMKTFYVAWCTWSVVYGSIFYIWRDFSFSLFCMLVVMAFLWKINDFGHGSFCMLTLFPVYFYSHYFYFHASACSISSSSFTWLSINSLLPTHSTLLLSNAIDGNFVVRGKITDIQTHTQSFACLCNKSFLYFFYFHYSRTWQ